MKRHFLIDRVCHNQRGAALIVVMGIMMLMWLVGMVAVDTAKNETDMTFNKINADQAAYIAEAGARSALVELDSNNTWRTGYAAVSFGGGQYWVTVTDSSSDSTLGDTVVVTSVADVQGAKANVEAWLIPDRVYPFQNALFGESMVDMRNSFATDSYNSDSGSYAATRLDSLGDIGSNGNIDADNHTAIGGSVTTSQSGGLSIHSGATVNGDTTDTAPVADLPPIPASQYSWAESNNDNTSGINGSYSYDPVSHAFQASGTVELSSGVYYFSSVVLKNSASLRVATGASVRIYVDGDMELKNSAEMNPTGDPDDMIILAQGDIVLKNGGEMRAVVYNPTGTIDMRNSGAFYGAVVADDIRGHNSAGFHYDRNLRNLTLGSSNTYSVVAWLVN